MHHRHLIILSSTGDSWFAPSCFGAGSWPWPPKCGQPMLETSFPMAFQRLDIRDGDLGVPLPGNQAKRRTVVWVPQNEKSLTCPWLCCFSASQCLLELTEQIARDDRDHLEGVAALLSRSSIRPKTPHLSPILGKHGIQGQDRHILLTLLVRIIRTVCSLP